ncbi:FCD domain-containing protein [Elioraea sp.]|jgi:DNA-binding GntR family transcriptional regulator|uniref:FCD domain-containing protein n=1 Tax=Elioraea sp. TaxID=2185103 RepID=UPI0021DEEE44|nr:FCD domain-containing protein [Elioraea sp.]GIX08587.1 MAG: putative transcriptional regulator, GntR family protein [Elioraea sp.]
MLDTPPIDIVRTQSLTSLVQREVERLILTGELAPGERINEQHLAARLRVSRGPVREALRGLEKARLVEAKVNRGVYVRELSVEQALEISEMRGLLTGYACARLAASSTAEQRARLAQLIETMAAAIAAGDAPAYYEHNLAFHDALMDYAGNARAKEMYDALVKESHLSRRKSLFSARAMAESNAEHRVILDAIRKGDATAAREAGERHIVGGRRRFLDAIGMAEMRPG